ncbi:MoxR family ATPase [Oceanicella sp. SM1341]|uniref:AAA family ATPase n=1 Tax=Oceanicella sp. SM1341 TaxID=1548889 RepID=UPI001E2F915C|nr:AAA family ATPase [Oceanicella sp. SM1341]
MAAALVGHEALVERLLVALLTGGHLLIEGPPGLAKTRSVRCLAEGIEGRFARIQCTPDLMPSDITGTRVFRAESGDMGFLPGPVFHELVLVDEINRAPPKVQSALLEAMAEGQVTVGGETRALPDPFMVIATQNSLENEGTFPLPEAQLDRFLMHVILELPGEAEERAILDLVEGELTQAPPEAAPPLDRETLAAMKRAVAGVHLSPALRHYIVALVMATRRETEGLTVTGRIRHAVSPRGSLALAACARARAFLHGRDHALPEDVAALAPDVLCHRLAPTWRALAAGETARGLLDEILAAVRPL